MQSSSEKQNLDVCREELQELTEKKTESNREYSIITHMALTFNEAWCSKGDHISEMETFPSSVVKI